MTLVTQAVIISIHRHRRNRNPEMCLLRCKLRLCLWVSCHCKSSHQKGSAVAGCRSAAWANKHRPPYRPMCLAIVQKRALYISKNIQCLFLHISTADSSAEWMMVQKAVKYCEDIFILLWFIVIRLFPSFRCKLWMRDSFPKGLQNKIFFWRYGSLF